MSASVTSLMTSLCIFKVCICVCVRIYSVSSWFTFISFADGFLDKPELPDKLAFQDTFLRKSLSSKAKRKETFN